MYIFVSSLMLTVIQVHVQDDLNLTDLSQKSNASTSNSSESTGILITNIKNKHSYNTSSESQLNDDLLMLPSPKIMKLPEKGYYDVSQTNTKVKVLCFHKLGPYRNNFTRAVEKQFVFTEVETYEDLQNVIDKLNEIKLCHDSVPSSQFNDIKSSYGYQFVEAYEVWRHYSTLQY